MRRQLTLFVPPPIAERLEEARRLLDPVQAGLIRAHVTLCRDEEVVTADLAGLAVALEKSRAGPVTLGFGEPEPFHGHGILLPCTSGDEEFQALRRSILGSATVQRQSPHITLAHPRNPKAPTNSMSTAALLSLKTNIVFSTICLIEQVGNSPWRIVEEFALTGGNGVTPAPSVDPSV